MSTIKSSAENLTLNADGANNDIIFQSNGSNVATLDQAGLLTATTFAGSGASLTALPAAQLTGSLPAISGASLTGITTGKVLQMKSTYSDDVMSASTSGSPTSSSAGVEVWNLTFTPTSSTSKLLIQTSSVSVYEGSNNGDKAWLALWLDTTFQNAVSGNWHHGSFNSSLQGGFESLNQVVDSWGTSAKSIKVRAGMDGGGAYVNGSSATSYTGSSARIYMTVTEVEV